MKSIVIVGGSLSHVPFIVAAKNLGYKTIVFDRDKNCQGAKVSDGFYKLSTHDVEKIISKCCEINEREKIAPKKKMDRLKQLREELNMKKGGKVKKKFPDLTGDGKVTQADILKGRGVFRKGGASK